MAGTTVRWDNDGRNDHNIIPVDDTQDWGVDIDDFDPGEVYEHVFTTPGRVRSTTARSTARQPSA